MGLRLLLQGYGFHPTVNHREEFLRLLRRHNHICVMICRIDLCFAHEQKGRGLDVAAKIVSSMDCIHTAQTFIYQAH